MMLKKRLNILKKYLNSNSNKVSQFLSIFVYHPRGLVLLPVFELSCQDCNNQLLLWNYKLFHKRWIVEEYKVNNDKYKCCDYLEQIKSKELQLMKMLKE